MQNEPSLRGRVAIVTGAGRGLGRSMALALGGASRWPKDTEPDDAAKAAMDVSGWP